MAFVVPAEIGHAPYAAPALEYLVGRFSIVHIVAVRKKLFPDLSEDCWLLYAEGCEGVAHDIRLTVLDRFEGSARPPRHFIRVGVQEWRTEWNRRLRPFLMSLDARDLYRNIAVRSDTSRFGALASVGIGYVSGANDFFHLRPSEAQRWGIPSEFLHPSVRNSRALQSSRVTTGIVNRWKRNDDPVLLLRLRGEHVPQVHAGSEAACSVYRTSIYLTKWSAISAFCSGQNPAARSSTVRRRPEKSCQDGLESPLPC